MGVVGALDIWHGIQEGVLSAGKKFRTTCVESCDHTSYFFPNIRDTPVRYLSNMSYEGPKIYIKTLKCM